jgi:hypothetical protein
MAPTQVTTALAMLRALKMFMESPPCDNTIIKHKSEKLTTKSEEN